MIECSHFHCNAAAKHKYLWPGAPEQYCCDKHKETLKGISSVMGFHIEVQPLPSFAIAKKVDGDGK